MLYLVFCYILFECKFEMFINCKVYDTSVKNYVAFETHILLISETPPSLVYYPGKCRGIFLFFFLFVVLISFSVIVNSFFFCPVSNGGSNYKQIRRTLQHQVYQKIKFKPISTLNMPITSLESYLFERKFANASSIEILQNAVIGIDVEHYLSRIYTFKKEQFYQLLAELLLH